MIKRKSGENTGIAAVVMEAKDTSIRERRELGNQ